MLVHAAALCSPTQFVLGVEPISLDAWLRILLVAATLLGAAVELRKVILRRL
ncbi:MAG: hypothetical protein U0075_08595 [Thermomicrobiales bacterium]